MSVSVYYPYSRYYVTQLRGGHMESACSQAEHYLLIVGIRPELWETEDAGGNQAGKINKRREKRGIESLLNQLSINFRIDAIRQAFAFQAGDQILRREVSHHVARMFAGASQMRNDQTVRQF